jgi:hypothetical protein
LCDDDTGPKSAHPNAGKISPFNPDAIRGPNGIWNETTLPVVEWESPENRVVVPVYLKWRLIHPIPDVLRWDREKYTEVLRKHPRDIPVVGELTRHLQDWRYLGGEIGGRHGNQRMLFYFEERWYAVTISVLQDSNNVVTAFGSSEPKFLRNRLRGMHHIVRREE